MPTANNEEETQELQKLLTSMQEQIRLIKRKLPKLEEPAFVELKDLGQVLFDSYEVVRRNKQVRRDRYRAEHPVKKPIAASKTSAPRIKSTPTIVKTNSTTLPDPYKKTVAAPVAQAPPVYKSILKRSSTLPPTSANFPISTLSTTSITQSADASISSQRWYHPETNSFSGYPRFSDSNKTQEEWQAEWEVQLAQEKEYMTTGQNGVLLDSEEEDSGGEREEDYND